MNWINAIHYGPLYGGRSSGLPAFIVEFNGSTPDSSRGEVAETLLLLRSFPAAQMKWLYLRGTFPAEEIYLHSFCRAARDSGFWILAESDGQLWRPWFTPECVNWLIVVNDGRPWMQFKCHEYRLHWDGESPPPDVPPELALTQFVLCPPDDCDSTRTLEFLRAAKGGWSVALKPRNAFRVQVYLRGE